MSAAPRLVLYHHGGCSKSRAALERLRERGVEFELRDYVAQPPDRLELLELRDSLGLPARALVREADAEGIALPGEDAGDDAWIGLLLAHPALLQRPILRRGGCALIARPPERVFELL